MACSSCSNPFEILEGTSTTCNCGTVEGTVPAQTEGEGNGCCVVSVNGKTGIVVLNINDIDLLGNQFFSNVLVWASLSGIAPISFNNLNGQISHDNSGVTPGTYGSASVIPVITVNAKGHITSVSTQSITAALLSVNLQNLDVLTGVGYLVKTATNTWVFRTLQGGAGRIAITNPAATLANTIIDLQNGIVTPGTYGNTTQYPIVTVDTYGRVTGITLQTVPTPAGDNWGSQVVQHDATLAGQGTSGQPLKIAQQGATTGQVLKWNGTTWIPATVPGDDWGAQVAQVNEYLVGNGTVANKLEVSRITKVEDAFYGPGGYTSAHTFTLTGFNAVYGTNPLTDKAFRAQITARIEVTTPITTGGSIIIAFEGVRIYELTLVPCDHEGAFTPTFVVDQSITDNQKIFLSGWIEEADSAFNLTSHLPKYAMISGAAFTDPEIEITVSVGIEANIGLTWEIDKKQLNKYVAQ